MHFISSSVLDILRHHGSQHNGSLDSWVSGVVFRGMTRASGIGQWAMGALTQEPKARGKRGTCSNL